MSVRAAVVGIATLFVIGLASSASADIIFDTKQGSIQPAEQLLFNDPVTGNPVTGHTNNTNTLFDIWSNETLSASGGQAVVGTPDTDPDRIYSLFFFTPQDKTGLFSEFEANINIQTQATGTATVLACNKDGNFSTAAPFNFNPANPQACKTFEMELGNGSNFFVLSVAGSELLKGIRVETSTGIVDVRQIRVTPATGDEISQHNDGDPLTPVPEPASLMLLGSGLFAGARVLRRRSA